MKMYSKHHTMKAYWGAEIYLHALLTSALDSGDWSASRPSRFTPGKGAPGTHWKRNWIGPRSGLDHPVLAENRTPIIQ